MLIDYGHMVILMALSLYVLAGWRGALLGAAVWGGGGGLRDEAPCGVPELRVTQASVSTRQLKRGIKEELDCLVQHRKQRVCTV